ncbi:MAG: CinA family nicotinamide mononucleotide deamidase-related protein [Polyangiaceae bacterium]|jgi:nicotinamide-nucleotide amidase|nr:CinA family nicotinamide mononucleotide deamidase-related protein [Polyangiaceae bacterium]
MNTAAVLCIGTELTRGEIINTNGPWLAARLTELGFEVRAVDVVDDDPERILGALRRLGAAHGVLVCSGGLGPTSDDLTTEVVARALGVAVVRHEPSLESMRRRYEKAGREVSASSLRQVEIPEGAEALPNPVGIAPGYSAALGSCFLVVLPGVPREVEGLWAEEVAPRLRSRVERRSFQIRLRTFGLPESIVGERLQGLEQAHPSLTLGYRATLPEVEVKVLVRGGDERSSREQAHLVADEVRARLGDAVYGEEDDTFPEVVARCIRERGWRLALAESCTGGLVAHLLTSAPVSDFFIASAVTYANSAKTRLLGVNEDVLRGHGAVSHEVAAAMAEGVRRVCNVEVALALTGIAGPTGGTPEKPVGLVHWAVAFPGGTVVEQRVFPGDRRQIQRMAAFAGLALLRRICLDEARHTPAAPRVV